MKHHVSLPILASACLFQIAQVSPAFAGVETEAIIVTGEPLSDGDGERNLSKLTLQAQADEKPAARLEDIISQVAGFQPYRRADTRSSHPTANGLSLRGLGGNAASRAPILLDGVPIGDPFGGWISWNALDPSALDRIELIRGGGLVDKGPGALSGAVELFSHGAEPATNGSLAYGSRNSLSASGLIARKLGNGAAMASARYDRGDGFTPVVASQRGPVDRPAPYESYSVRLRGIAPLWGGELQAGVGAFSDARERGTPFTQSDQRGGQASLRYVATGNWDVEALAYATLRDFDTSFARVFPGRATVAQALDQSTSANGLGAKIELRPPVGETVDMRFGGDFSLVDGTTRELASFSAGSPRIRREAGGQNHDIGMFAAADWRAGDALLLSVGLRGDATMRRDGRLVETDLTAAPLAVPATFADDRDDFYLSGRIGASLEIDEGFIARTAAYRSFRQPTLNELYRPYRVGADGIAANPFLNPERLTGGEIGIDWQSEDGRAEAALTAFYVKLDDAITNVTLATSPGGGIPCAGVGTVFGACQQRQNVDAIRSKGIEFDASYNHRRFDARISLALTDAEMRASGAAAALDGMRPAQLPKAAASFSLGWKATEALTLNGTVQWQAARFEDDLETQRLDGFTRVDLGGDYRLGNGLSIGVVAENVFDKRIETGVSGNGIYERTSPRTIWASVRFRD